MPTVLIVAAGPLNQDRLRTSAEVKAIRQALQRSINRENWRIESNEAATVDELRRGLLDYKPTVVHSAGHGHADGGLCFENDDGQAHLSRVEPVAKLFHLFKAGLKCVVLNACYSEVQANLIREEIDYVIGMQSAIGDESATKFSVAFYDALFAGTDFRTAFDLGCTTLDLKNVAWTAAPVFLTAPHLKAAKLIYDARVPAIERFLHSYLNTPFAERAPFTTVGETLLPAILRYYGDRPHIRLDRTRVVSMQDLGNDKWRVVAELSQGEKSAHRNYFLHLHDRSTLIEWEATIGLWSIPPKVYLATGADGAVVARVTAEISGYYNLTFDDDKAHLYQSVALATLEGPSLHGYVRRNTPTCDEILKIISDGNPHEVTLEISNIGNPETSRIERVLSRNWIYHEAAAPSQE